MGFDSRDVLGVYRESCFSPGMVREDAAILDAAVAELGANGEIRTISPENLSDLPRRPAVVLNMARSGQALEILEAWETQGTRVFNSSAAVRNCYRKNLMACLGTAGIPFPPSFFSPLKDLPSRLILRGGARYWLKRGDVHTMQPADVVAIESAEQMVQAMAHFQRHGVEELLVQEHAAGEVIKFYGVGMGEFFCAFSSAGKDISDELKDLPVLARHAAAAAGLAIYGGDAVLTPEGRTLLVDLNDWPSFSRCRPAAAKSMSQYIMGYLTQ